jgi:hypothetical protein
MSNIRHEEISRDSLYKDIDQNLDTVFELWRTGNKSIRFAIPILCAAKLEAFINVAGMLHIKHWDILERKLAFVEKGKIVCAAVGFVFDAAVEPNKSAVLIFETRNALVHPKMKLKRINESISHEEYERRRENIIGVSHNLRSELTQDKIVHLKETTEAFVEVWGTKLLEGVPDYWLGRGSTGGFRLEKDG